ncbi:MAG: hypothetical protein WD872_03675 [Pirellulaceae bacterium]
MSIGSLGIIGGLATAAQSQRTAEVDRAGREAAERARETQSELKAESASGIGETEEDSQTSERDADGRRLWERPPQAGHPGQPAPEDAASPTGKDPTGESGGELDLVG